MAVPERKHRPSPWQLNVAWPQRKEWEARQKRACYCGHLDQDGAALTDDKCLARHAVRDVELLARDREGVPVLPANARQALRYPTFRGAGASFALELCRLVYVCCLEQGARAVYLEHENFAELCRRRLHGGSAKSSHNAKQLAIAAGWLVQADGHGTPGELPDGKRPCRRISGEPLTASRRGNYYEPGPLMLEAAAAAGWPLSAWRARAARDCRRLLELERRREARVAATEQKASGRRWGVRIHPATVAKRPDLALRPDLDPSRYAVDQNRARWLAEGRSRPLAGTADMVPEPGQAAELERAAPLARADCPATHEAPPEGRPPGAPRRKGEPATSPPVAPKFDASANRRPATAPEAGRGGEDTAADETLEHMIRRLREKAEAHAKSLHFPPLKSPGGGEPPKT